MTDLPGSEIRESSNPKHKSEQVVTAKKVRQLTNPEKLQMIADAIEQKSIDQGMEGFSIPAAAAIIEGQAAYFRELAERAIDHASADGLEVISERHVDRAKRDLRRADYSTFQTALTIAGGALLGTSAQEIFNILNTSGTLEKQSVLLTMLMLALGVALVVFALVPRRRD